jgi:hypothetical protein
LPCRVWCQSRPGESCSFSMIASRKRLTSSATATTC